jgi:hypothetical protein
MSKYGRSTGHGRQGPPLGRYAFVWQQGTIADDDRELLPFLDRIKVDFGNSAARGINDSGRIVGFTGSGKGSVGNDARGYEVLIAPGADASAGLTTICQGINNAAQVVCSVIDVNGTTVAAFIGSPDEGEGRDR